MEKELDRLLVCYMDGRTQTFCLYSCHQEANEENEKILTGGLREVFRVEVIETLHSKLRLRATNDQS